MYHVSDSFPCSTDTISSSIPVQDSLFVLKQEIERLTAENNTLRKEKLHITNQYQLLLKQHLVFHDDFHLLKEKYDDLKKEVFYLLWTFIPSVLSGGLTLNHDGMNDSCSKEEGQHPLSYHKSSFLELSNIHPSIKESSEQINEFSIGDVIGNGQYAIVRAASHMTTKMNYAIKIIQKQNITTLSGLRRVQNELYVLQQLNHHPNLIHLVSVINTTSKVYYVTDLYGKDLFDYLQLHASGLRETPCMVRDVLLGIASAITYLHSQGIVHRDLKPENVLMTNVSLDGCSNVVSKPNIILCDFGQSAMVGKPKTRDDYLCPSKESARKNGRIRYLSDLSGSPGFFAPEMLSSWDVNEERQGQASPSSPTESVYCSSIRKPYYHGFMADVWSLGCILLELVQGPDEFSRNWMVFYDYHVLEDASIFEFCLKNAVKSIVHSLKASIKDDVRTNHERFDEYEVMMDFLGNMLTVDPMLRIPSCDLLSHPFFSMRTDVAGMGSMERL